MKKKATPSGGGDLLADPNSLLSDPRCAIDYGDERLVFLYRNFKRSELIAPGILFACGLCLCVLALILHTLVGFTLYVALLSGLCCVLWALLWGTHVYSRKERLQVDHNGIDWRIVSYVSVKRRFFPWHDFVKLHYGTSTFQGYWGAELETRDGKSFYLFRDLRGKNASMVVALINSFISLSKAAEDSPETRR